MFQEQSQKTRRGTRLTGRERSRQTKGEAFIPTKINFILQMTGNLINGLTARIKYRSHRIGTKEEKQKDGNRGGSTIQYEEISDL